MNSVPYAYEPADVEAAIANGAQRVIFKKGALVPELVRMPRVKYLVVEYLFFPKLPELPPK